MNCNHLLLMAAAALVPASAAAQAPTRSAWTADLGNGEYQNPVLYADYSDPDVCRVGDDYYLTASSFNCTPGLPILHSRDLVNWTFIGHALDRVMDAASYEPVYHPNSYDQPRQGDGVWAPAIRHHDGWFYIFWGDPDEGIFMVKATNPAGPWQPPVLVRRCKGIIDTCPFWDDNGRAYIGHGFAGSRAGVKSILGLIEMAPDGSRTIGEDRLIYDGHVDNVTIEGVKMYRRDGYYYIMCPAGGVATGWQLAMRSKDIYGPYEWRVVMRQGKSDVNGPHQGGWVDTPDGREHWFVHFQDQEAYGRVMHLQPLTWQDGWPIVGSHKKGETCGTPVARHKKPALPAQTVADPATSDEFGGNALGPQWQWMSNANALWHFADAAQGQLRLFSWPWPDAKNLWGVGNLLLQKFPAPNFTCTARVRFHPSDKHQGERAGLLVFGQDYAALTLTNEDGAITLAQTRCLKAKKGTAETTVGKSVKVQPDQWLYLRAQVRKEGTEARVTFSYSTDGTTYQTLGDPFTAQPGQWIGAKMGLFCQRQATGVNDGGWLDADFFRVE